MDATAMSTIPSLHPFSLSVQSTQLDESCRYMLSPSFGLTLEDMELIKKHMKANGSFGESQEVSYKWLVDNITILHCLIPQSGNNLEHLIGKEYLYVKDALLALNLLSHYGIITAEELASSDDAKLLMAVRNSEFLCGRKIMNFFV
ncbi:unnamed protein product [Strongylus vulgaris]|uniref:Uncharacterized protein n=1 Tax=Strongylus vulgaris TaxID=40348 RepID=A0A3P7IW83_STRVU|nr:unnamed protein product [Strongylus vulgaris]